VSLNYITFNKLRKGERKGKRRNTVLFRGEKRKERGGGDLNIERELRNFLFSCKLEERKEKKGREGGKPQ